VLTAVHWTEMHGPQLMGNGMAVTAFIGNSMSEVVVEVVR
jgi:hypothetical protein